MSALLGRNYLAGAVILCLSASFAFAAGYPDTATVSSAEKQRLIDEVMENSGMRARIKSLPDAMVKQMQPLTQSSPNISPAKVEEIVRANFSAQIIDQKVVAALASQYDEKHLRGYIAVITSPVWTHIAQSGSVGSSEADLQAFLNALDEHPVPASRWALIKKIEDGSGAAKLMTEMINSFISFYGDAMISAFPGQVDEVHRMIDPIAAKSVERMRTVMLISEAYTYRNLADSELQAYLALVQSDDVQWFNSIVHPAVQSAMEEGVKALSVQVVALMMPSLPEGQPCVAPNTPSGERIKSCTQAIASGKLTAAQRAVAYMMRGLAREDNKDLDGALADMNAAAREDPSNADVIYGRGGIYADRHDAEHALADFTEVIRRQPQNTDALRRRASLWVEKYEYDRALADESEVLRLRPDHGGALRRRAEIYFLRGNFDLAAQDFIATDPLAAKDDWLQHSQPYIALWLYLAREHGGADGAGEFAQRAQALASDKWPAPVVGFYLGKLKPEELLSAAKNADSGTEQDQLCEARFYLGEWYLTHGNPTEGKQLMIQVRATCRHDFVEYDGAVAELGRLH